MKKLANILFGLMAAMSIAAQERPAQAPAYSSECEAFRIGWNLKYNYCECMENSQSFAFPMVIEVKDTMWFQAEVKDLLQGLSAYWFSDCSVVLEAYAFCESRYPTLTLTVGQNQMRDMDAEDINAKIQNAGEVAQGAIDKIQPHVRIYPATKGCPGTVYCYPYDQGPRSKCDNPIPLYPRMTYVCDTTENVYRMDAKSLPSSGRAFVHWKQKQNKPCEIWLTLDDCTGDTIGQAVLSDSLHVYQPDAAVLQQVKTDGRSVWLHVRHAEGVTGRIRWFNNPRYKQDALPVFEKDTCVRLNQSVSIDLRTYTSDTTFTDTLWVNADSLTTRNVNIHFIPPTVENITVYMNDATIKNGYKEPNTGKVFRDYGDYTLIIESKEACTRQLQLAIIREELPTICDQPTALAPATQGVCSNAEHVFKIENASLPESGKAFVFWKQLKNEPCEILFTLDSCTGEEIGVANMTDSLHVYLLNADLLKKAKQGNHSVWLYLTQAAGKIGRLYWYNDPVFATPRAKVDKEVCLGKKINEKIDLRTYTTDTAFTDTLWLKPNTLTTREINLRTVPQPIEYDTVEMNDITIVSGYTYPSTDLVFTDYGDHSFTIEKPNQCTRFIQLTIERVEIVDPTTIEQIQNQTPRAYKRIENGQLFIIIDERKYTITGQQIKTN